MSPKELHSQNNDEIKNHKKKIYISPEKGQQITDELKLVYNLMII